MSLFPFKAWIIGDPHFTSLDGYQYTFNGLGDYQVGLIYDGQTLVYEIQGRTQRVVNKETGELGQATFFDAFAIRKENTTVRSLYSPQTVTVLDLRVYLIMLKSTEKLGKCQPSIPVPLN